MGLEITQTNLNEYISKLNLSNDEVKEINSVFDECDNINDNDVLQDDEVPNFLKIVQERFINAKNRLNNAGRSVFKYLQELSGMKDIDCILTEEQKNLYSKTLEDAKNFIIYEHPEMFDLTKDEIEYIKNTTTVSRNYGAAEYDRIEDQILFNYNSAKHEDTFLTPDKGDFIKVLIHEATHASTNSSHNSKSEERKCETRALMTALKLYNSNPRLIEDFEIIKGSNIYLSQLKTERDLNDFIEEWIKRGYNNLPED